MLCEGIIQLPQTPQWEMDIYIFIQDWLSDKDYIVVKTSGSTGDPKIINLKKKWLEYSATQTCNFFNLNKQSTALLCLPAAYIAGRMMIVRAFVSGMNLLIVEPSGNPFNNQSIDFTAITPFQLHQSLQTLKNKPLVKSIIVGGGEISKSIEREVQELPVDIYATYGMTETSSHIALRRVNGADRENFYTVIGQTSIGLDDRGCLTIENPNLFEGKLITNDLIEIVDTNKFHWLGRYDNIINSGGIKIIPEEVEQSIANLLPQAFVISSISDEKLSEAVVLVVEGDELPIEEKDSLLSQIKELVHAYAVPKQIINLPQLPKTPTGKVDRSFLKNIITTI
jgi:o-succinylbenzoate---CoA ligase